MDRRQLAVLRALAAWRERQARERDLPRNFVLSESALVALARRQPQRAAELAKIPDLPPKQVERHGETLLRLVREARELPPEAQPERAPKGARDERGRQVLDQLQERVRLHAEELGIPAPVLASRRELKQLLHRGPGDGPPPALAGWRWERLGGELTALVEEARARGVLGLRDPAPCSNSASPRSRPRSPRRAPTRGSSPSSRPTTPSASTCSAWAASTW